MKKEELYLCFGMYIGAIKACARNIEEFEQLSEFNECVIKKIAEEK